MFDPECLELAVYFLPHAPIDAQHRLAQAIQDAVEAFGNEEESQQEAAHA